MKTDTPLALSDEDIDELRQAIRVYREDCVRMARLMQDARYLNSLPWAEGFLKRLAEGRTDDQG